MSIRSLDLLDLPSLARYRRDLLPLNSARMLTRGDPLGAAALLSHLNPRRRVFTAVATGADVSLMGQVMQSAAEAFARLTFLAPASAPIPADALLEHLAAQAGNWGALHLLAEVDEGAPAFKDFRRAGFSMYAWQRVWKLAELSARQDDPAWQESAPGDLLAIQGLHGQIVPPLLQAVDAPPRKTGGMVCRMNGELKAYVRPESGPAGIWLQPLVHPDSDCVPEKLTALLNDLPQRAGRPVYVCVRSYQAWLEAVLEDLGAQAGPRQAVMVKRLAKPQRVEEKIPVMEKALNPAAPIARTTEMLYSGKEKR